MLRSILVALLIALAPLGAKAQGLSPKSMTESRLNVLNDEMQGKVIEARQAYRAGLEGANSCDEDWVRQALYRLDKLRADTKAKEQYLVDLREQMNKNLARILKKLAELIPGFDESTIADKLGKTVAKEMVSDLASGVAKDAMKATFKGLDVVETIDKFEKAMGKAIKRDKILTDAVIQEGEIQLAGILIDQARETQKEISALIEKLNQQWDVARAGCKDSKTVARLGTDPGTGQKQPGADVAKGNVVVVDRNTQRPIPGGKVVKISDDPQTPPQKPKEGDGGGKVVVEPYKPWDEFVFDFPCHGMITMTGEELTRAGNKISLNHKPLKLTFVGYRCIDVTDRMLNEQLEKQYNVRQVFTPKLVFNAPGVPTGRPELSDKGKDFPVCEVTVYEYEEIPKQTPMEQTACVPGMPQIPWTPQTPQIPGPGGITDGGFPWDPGLPFPVDPMTPYFPGLPKQPGTTEKPGTGEKFVEGDVPIEGQGPATNDPLASSKGSWGQTYADQWYLKAINWLKADGRTVLPERATPVIVAVIDTGIDKRHPELLGALWTNPNKQDDGKDNARRGTDVNGWNFINNSSDISDRNGHGTVVAGIIAALPDNGLGISGINPWARIMALKVTNHANKGGSVALASAIMYAADNGARIINLSVGGKGQSKAVQTAIDYAATKGVLVVAASGNLGTETTDFFPGGARNTLTVAATDPSDKRTVFSNWGAGVGIAAPGVDILSLRAAGTDLLIHEKKDYKPGTAIVKKDYYRVTGSSFAAPIVSGVASLLLSINPNLTAEQVRRMIVHSARDIDVPGKDQFTGYGLIDAAAAIEADPNLHLVANIASVDAARAQGRVVLRVSGSATANDFKSAWIEAGAGDSPASWTPVSSKLEKPAINAPLFDLDPLAFKGAKNWTLRLMVEHRNGKIRESRYALGLE
jgi:subtilisin family serine protease